jgi:16S rRNA processing protein RimM
MGRIVAPYGIKGWVKVLPMTSEPETLLGHATWWVRGRGGVDAWTMHTLEAGRQHGAILLAQLSGLADREAAALLNGADIGVPRAALPAPAEGEIYWSDLTGLAVVNREGVHLGVVAGVQDFGAHPILRVAKVTDTGASAERLIPFVDAYVDGIDVEARRIDVDWQQDY